MTSPIAQDTLRQAPAQAADSPADLTNVLAAMDPWLVAVLVGATLVALLLSLWMVYFYINRIRTDAIRRQMLHDAIQAGLYSKLAEQTYWSQDWEEGDDPRYIDYLENQRRQYESELRRLEEKIGPLSGKASRSADEEALLAEHTERTEWLRGHLEGEFGLGRIAHVRERHNQRKHEREQHDKKLRETAAAQATLILPESLTIAGMGITGGFFIELTAILTIIFGVILLGLVGVLGTREIAPILAAIAGYVLGKTTSATPASTATPATTATPAAATGTPATAVAPITTAA